MRLQDAVSIGDVAGLLRSPAVAEAGDLLAALVTQQLPRPVGIEVTPAHRCAEPSVLDQAEGVL